MRESGALAGGTRCTPSHGMTAPEAQIPVHPIPTRFSGPFSADGELPVTA